MIFVSQLSLCSVNILLHYLDVPIKTMIPVGVFSPFFFFFKFNLNDHYYIPLTTIVFNIIFYN